MLLRLFKAFSLVTFLMFASHSAANTSEPTININTATAVELAEVIRGVGIKKAERIVAYREAKGSFRNVSELANVKGIGVNIIEKNLSLLRVETLPAQL